jgi:aspartyl-tRNA(Asn)/glutamyl-tRNA(Gln) amidotransferase subunit A
MPEPRTITEAAGFIRRGELTPAELLEQCLARIDRYEDRVRAWAYLDRDRARGEAQRLTEELKRGEYRGPLHGIPVGVKDIIDVFDVPTACGSRLWANSYARRDATVVERLRQAGAVIVGKTVTTAFASFDPPVTRNPWNLDRTPGGSSSGSAAAVACGMCLGALATQTGGSITRPASYCGVCSLKPTYGRVSVDGVLPLAPSMDHVGVMANCVRDLAIMYPVLSWVPVGYDAEQLIPSDHPPRFAVLGGLFFDRATPVVTELMSRVIETLRAAGSEVFVIDPPEGFADVEAAHRTVMATEAGAYHEQRINEHPEDYPPNISGLIREGLSRSGVEYVRAMQLAAHFRTALLAAIGETDWTYLTPATTSPAPTPETTGDPVFNSPWSLFGMPTVSLPAGWSIEGLPIGLQLVGAPHADDELLRRALWCEQTIRFEPRPVPL